MPIVLCRVDDRLVHGQVVIGWGRPLDLQRIVLVDDEVRDSEWEQELYRMAAQPEITVEFASAAEAEADGARIDDLDRLDRLLRLRVGPGDLGRALGAPGEADVLGRHRRAVAPQRVGAQPEDELASVGGEPPALGERGREGGRVLGPIGLLGQQREEELVEQLGGESDAARDQLVDSRQVHRGADRGDRPRRLARRSGSARGSAAARGQESRAERCGEPAEEGLHRGGPC